MSDSKERFLEAVQLYIEAGEQLAGGIVAFNEMNRSGLADMQAGMSVTESFAIRDSAEWSRSVTSLLDAFESTRRMTRESAAEALMDEGRSTREIGTAFGTTRQWADRLVHKAPEPGA